MYKKLLPILVVSLIMAMALVSCGEKQPGEAPPFPPPPAEETLPPLPEPPLTEEPSLPTEEPPPPTEEPPLPSSPTPSELTMLSISEGEVFIMKSGTESWATGEVGMTLEPGDTIKAGDNSRAVITFFEGSTIELEADTEISVVELSIAIDTGSTTIKLGQEIGRTVSRVEKLLDSTSSYEVETPAAVAVVRGSTMYLDVDENGNSTAGNGDGDICLEAEGEEVCPPPGYHTTAKKGKPPTSPKPGLNPEDAPKVGGGGSTQRPPAPRPGIAIVKTADPTEAGDDDTITYTYQVTNSSNIPLSNVHVDDDIAGDATYVEGDANDNDILDLDETWTFTATYIISTLDDSPLVNTATAYGTDASSSVEVTAQDSASVTIRRVLVEITTPGNGDTVYIRTITVAGTVSDPSIEEAVISINDRSHTIAVASGNFSTEENVSSGENIITVEATDGVVSGSDTVTISADIPTSGIWIELTWNTNNTDLDIHLIRPGGVFEDLTDDCYYDNPNPDWGQPDVAEDNPSLDTDVQGGYGPENIVLEQPDEEGTYECKVHYYSSHGYGPSVATVRIWINGVFAAEFSQEMFDSGSPPGNAPWDCADIEWPSGTVTPGSAP